MVSFKVVEFGSMFNFNRWVCMFVMILPTRLSTPSSQGGGGGKWYVGVAIYAR